MSAARSSVPFEDGRVLPARSLALYFDYTCPFAYLGSTQARALAARMGVTLEYKPILLGGVFKAVGTPQDLMGSLGPAKAAHNAADMMRWARRWNVPLTMPPHHPMRSVEALRATLATKIDPKVVDGFYRAYWVENRAISSREVIADVVGRAGHDVDAVLASIETPAIKDELRKRTDEAIARGVFGVPTWVVDGEHLYWGQDRLAFVEGVRPALRAPSVKTTKTLEVYWDFSSPFAYLASTQIENLAARTGARVVWKPVLLGGLFRAIGTPDVPMNTFSEAKRDHVDDDLHRWAAYWGVPFKFPSRFPTRSLDALRVWLALPPERRAHFQAATFRAYWVEDRDIADRSVLAACIGDDALGSSIVTKTLERADSDEIKAELRASTEAAVARGVFGVPTCVVGTELFWGQDRLELVEEALVS
jgi:2-hydroxychromene-2-carboxylate isomerase